uniref:Uncharacterized protein n=1 Tax=Arundo donax TaxID=35708 RepID=A0A0A9EXA9_ARUDO
MNLGKNCLTAVTRRRRGRSNEKAALIQTGIKAALIQLHF